MVRAVTVRFGAGWKVRAAVLQFQSSSRHDQEKMECILVFIKIVHGQNPHDCHKSLLFLTQQTAASR